MYGDNEVGEDGLTKKERQFKEDSIAYDKMVDEMIQKQVDNMELLGINVREYPDEPCLEEIQKEREENRAKEASKAKQEATTTRRTRSVSTVRARAAAAALNRSASPSLDQEKPAAGPKTRKASSTTKKKTPAPTNPSSMRAAAAAANSKTTVGYSKGRSVSSALQGKTTKTESEKPASNSFLSPEKYMELYGPPPFGSDMWIRCKMAGYLKDDKSADDEVEEVLPIYEEDEEELNFQLTL